MPGILTNTCLARIPVDALSLLGRLRAHPSVQVRADARFLWVRWDEAGFEVPRVLLPVQGARFFERADKHWRLCGRTLPVFDVPDDGFVPLASALVPKPQQTVPERAEPAPRLVLALKRSTVARPATALLCRLATLSTWIELAASRDLNSLDAARCGETVMLTGQRLPPLDGERLWGEHLLCPLGWTPDPDLPESALLEALGADHNELALMRHAGIDIIPRDAFSRLTRASVRLGAT
ncbi:MAG: hypothetical protein K8I27_00015 [Planctomycetes bacterium]|nr:hypothetical protein [Planctomycetota bacterium]